MEQVVQIADLIAAKLAEMASTDVVVGEPLSIGNVTLVPLSSVSVGFGGGGGMAKGEFDWFGWKRKPHRSFGDKKDLSAYAGSGGGGGGKVRPVAVVVFAEDGVRVEPIPDRKGLFDKIFDRIPELIEAVRKD